MIRAESLAHRLTLTTHIRENWPTGCKCKVCDAVDRQEEIQVLGRKQ